MTPEQEALSNRAHDVLDRAASMIEGLGFEPVPAWRMMGWCALDAIVAGSCHACARADLMRLRTMIDVRLAALADEASPQ